MTTPRFCGQGWLGVLRCDGLAVSMVSVLAACGGPRATAAAQPAGVDTEAITGQPDPAPPPPEPPMNAVQVVAHRLFGEAIGPVFEFDYENQPAPDGYINYLLSTSDFDANGLTDLVLVVQRDPAASNPRAPECALVLTVGTDDVHSEVCGVNPHEFGCHLVQEDGSMPTKVGDSTVTITEGDASFELSFDPAERRFVLSQLSLLMLDPETQNQYGTFLVFRPLEGRGEIVAWPRRDDEEPEPTKFDPQRVYFEDIGPRTREHFMGLKVSSALPEN